MKVSIIIATTLLMLASCNPKADATQQQAAPVKKDISLQLYSLRDDIAKDYDATIKKAGEMGFTSVEAANYADGKFYGKTPEEFKASIEKAGMKVLSSHTGKGLTEKELASKDFTEALKWYLLGFQGVNDNPPATTSPVKAQCILWSCLQTFMRKHWAKRTSTQQVHMNVIHLLPPVAVGVHD